jgi:hypothetical protein
MFSAMQHRRWRRGVSLAAAAAEAATAAATADNDGRLLSNPVHEIHHHIEHGLYGQHSNALSDKWEGYVPLDEYCMKMQWWWLSEGQRVFSLVMGRHPSKADGLLYHVHQSRYSVYIRCFHESGLLSSSWSSEHPQLVPYDICLN